MVVRKAINWANLPPLSEADLGQRAIDWLDELESEIPANRLMDCLSRARKNHDNSFPINLYDISNAWKELQHEETQARCAAEIQDRIENPIDYCPLKGEHLSDAGTIMVYNPFDWAKRIEMPCPHCRLDAYNCAMTEFKAKHARLRRNR